jgi:uracil-DNA glycosylase family 4
VKKRVARSAVLRPAVVRSAVARPATRAIRPESPGSAAETGAILAALEKRVVACGQCPRLREYCANVAIEKRRAFRDESYWGRPVPAFGDPRARLLIVGLAPAAHGGNRTGRMFTGDSSGDWLYAALHDHGFASQPHSIGRDDGLVLKDAFITAAARCAPPENRPDRDELVRCRRWLEAEVALLARVRVVVTLGTIAHDAWLHASGWWEALSVKARPRFAHGTETLLADGRRLLSSYHPSRQNTNTGRLTREMWNAIFARAREIVNGER